MTSKCNRFLQRNLSRDAFGRRKSQRASLYSGDMFSQFSATVDSSSSRMVDSCLLNCGIFGPSLVIVDQTDVTVLGCTLACGTSHTLFCFCFCVSCQPVFYLAVLILLSALQPLLSVDLLKSWKKYIYHTRWRNMTFKFYLWNNFLSKVVNLLFRKK